jgi:pyridinium-3,5-bisthiocarboxylic acid mononucleotide nickel chelatase
MAGVSGDMMLGALIDAGADAGAIQKVLDLIPRHFSRCKNIKLTTSEVKKHGFRACKAEVTITEDRDETKAEDLIRATEETAAAAKLSPQANSFANNAVRLLTEVESKLHGVDLSSTHLHEAGSTDTLADILGTAAACDSLRLFEGEIDSYPVAVGGGTVNFSHGTVSVPTPAVLEIARQDHIPIVGGPSREELATPTGISILASLADRFVEMPPPLIPDRVGYGAGRRDLPDAPNVLRLIVGESSGEQFERDSIRLIETNLDDVSGEIAGHSLQRILDAGAKDVWITPAQFKKSRPGYTLHAICGSDDLERISQTMMRETGTLGVRYQRWDRFILQREITTIKLELEKRTFEVRIKIARDRLGKILRIKPEFEDLDSISSTTSRPIREISDAVLEQARKELGGQGEGG